MSKTLSPDERRARRLETLRACAKKRRRKLVDAVSVEVPKGFGPVVKEFGLLVKQSAETGVHLDWNSIDAIRRSYTEILEDG